MIWLCKLDPPLSHVHAGRKLFHIVKRVKAWLSGINRRESVGAGVNVATSSSSNSSSRSAADSRSCCGDPLVDVMWRDFTARRDGLCRSLQDVLAQSGAR